MITGTCQYCGKKFERQNAVNLKQIVDEHEATCDARLKGGNTTQTVPEQQHEEPKMAEETKIYTHPDGTVFESAEQLLDYVDMLKDGQAVAENKTAATFELAPMIKGIKPQMRERGRITIGKKGAPNASGRGRKTVRFDHFVFTTTDKDETTDDYILDDAMNERYGKDCREIPVRFLSDNITEIFHTSYMKYTASGLKLMGDGENWIQYNADGTRTYITDPNGDHGFLDDPDVKPHKAAWNPYGARRWSRGGRQRVSVEDDRMEQYQWNAGIPRAVFRDCEAIGWQNRILADDAGILDKMGHTKRTIHEEEDPGDHLRVQGDYRATAGTIPRCNAIPICTRLGGCRTARIGERVRCER
jgi:hypothetical protein